MQIVVQRAEFFERPFFDVLAGEDSAAVIWAAEMGDHFVFRRIPIAGDRPMVAAQRVVARRFDLGRFQHRGRLAFVDALRQPAECPSVERRRAARLE